jgi:hypothetical protein
MTDVHHVHGIYIYIGKLSHAWFFLSGRLASLPMVSEASAPP